MIRADDLQGSVITPKMQEVIESIAAALTAAGLYLPKNPVYAASIKKTYSVLSRYLTVRKQCRFQILNNGFGWSEEPSAVFQQELRTCAADLYEKGFREIIFCSHLTETELTDFIKILSFPRITNANTIQLMVRNENFKGITVGTASEQRIGDLEKKKIEVFGISWALSEIVSDPARFSLGLLEQAGRSQKVDSELPAFLYASYRDAGVQVRSALKENAVPLFNAMAASILSLGPRVRDSLVQKMIREQMRKKVFTCLYSLPENGEHLEIMSLVYSNPETIAQLTALLMNVSAEDPPAPPVPVHEACLPPDLQRISREMSEYSNDEMDRLTSITDYGRERDMTESIAGVLASVLPLVQDSFSGYSKEKTVRYFSSIVMRLESTLLLFLRKKDYRGAAFILQSFKNPVSRQFKALLARAVQQAGDKKIIAGLIDDICKFRPDSSEYEAAYGYLSLLDREATPVLLEMLAEEEDRTMRKLLTRVLKDLGKNQIALLGEKLSDERWYFVRNIVNILGESGRDEVITYLEKVTDHKNFQIRQEVLRALLSIGGARAADMLVRFLNDDDIDIRFMAIRGLGSLSPRGGGEEKALIAFLGKGWFKKTNSDLRLEAISSLGKVGGREAAGFLAKYAGLKWWLPKKSQQVITAAASKAIAEIERRQDHA